MNRDETLDAIADDRLTPRYSNSVQKRSDRNHYHSRSADSVEAIVQSLLVGESLAMRRVRALILRLAPSRLPIHVHGPTGSGKELVARAIHMASGLHGKLVSLNMAAIAEGVFESTLFGHVRGSFTGAVSSEAGALMEANGGTVFFDEISGLSASGQAKLLRAIELQEFRPVGARSDRSSAFRVLSATNDDLDSRVVRGHFRQDLLHRLKGAVIVVPPLRQRPEDIVVLARLFASRYGSDCNSIDGEAEDHLTKYEWPGNVRELLLVVQCASALAQSDPITISVLKEAMMLQMIGASQTSMRAESRSGHLLAMLEHHHWDIDAVARALKVHRATVYRRLQRYQLNTNR